MCGIVGILQTDGTPANADLLRPMMDAIVHRGPDDEGVFEDGPVALGFRRLSIIDLACGHQPLTTADGRYTIVFNGEVYNYREVREVLQHDHGREFLTNSDTEVIVNAVAQWGEGALPRLNGMFAFAVWDTVERRLFLARDRLGKKPLHFVRTGNALIYASETKSLLAHPDVPRDVDTSRIPTFVTYRYLPGVETLFRGIEVLQPACSMTATPGGEVSLPRRWWDYEFKGRAAQDAKEEVLVEELRELLTDAVRLRMIADVPFGAFLSGGLDSSLIVALMSQLHPEPLKTFSIGFDTGFSETNHARTVAQKFNTHHHELVVSSDDLMHAIPAALHARECPISEPSDIPIFLLSELARKKVTVVLSGEGSDEIFAGYPKYAFENRFGWMRSLPPALLATVARKLPARLRGPQLALECMSAPDKLESYACWFGAFGAAGREHLLAPQYSSTNVHQFSELALVGRDDFSSRVEEMLYLDTRHWLPANLLLRGDRMTMAHSLELRCPFMDYRLVEFAARRVPLRNKVRGSSGKHLLKKLAERYLPHDIVHRNKWGFKVPVSEWFRGPMAGVLRDTLFSPRALQRGYFQQSYLRHLVDDHTTARADHGKQLWILFQLELWHLMFIDHVLSPHDSLTN